MAQYLNKLNPIPTLPEYTGPYKVGTVDVEIPVDDLYSPSETPDTARNIQTIQFRVFYPATPDSAGKRIAWLPNPQRTHVAAYAKFLGAGPLVSEMISFIPRHLHYATIPVHKNATLLSPEHAPRQRWPTMMFSHGLGGNRNAYSHIAGSLAAHGVVVFCPEHRDGSAACTFVRDPDSQNKFFAKSTRTEIPYEKIAHTPGDETWEARNRQLEIRLWELGLTHEAILDLDEGKSVRNLNGSTPAEGVAQFTGKLDVQQPGKMIFGGHSFGAATIVQFLKSVYYAGESSVQKMAQPLFQPSLNSRIRAQITSRNPTILLDMWCFPLLAPSSAALHSLPLPAYADTPESPGGDAILAVESDAFVNWTEHLHATARILSPRPDNTVVKAQDFRSPKSGRTLSGPHFFHAHESAHLSQSDFGVLFPWLTKKIFGAAEPERPLRLNMRAILQTLRNNNIAVGRTWEGDLVEGPDMTSQLNAAKKKLNGSTESLPSSDGDSGVMVSQDGHVDDGIDDDSSILDKSGNVHVEAWSFIDVVGMGAYKNKKGKEEKPSGLEGEEEMEGEIDPQPANGTSTVKSAVKVAT